MVLWFFANQVLEIQRFGPEIFCFLPSTANLMQVSNQYLSNISKLILPILAVFSFLNLHGGMEPAGMGRWMHGTACSLSHSASSAALGRTGGCSPGGRSGHTTLFSAHNWQLPPPTQTDPAMFLKCSQQLETKATPVSYWKSPSKAASLPWTTLGHVNSADYPSLTLLIYHPPLLSICSSE